MSVSSLGLYAPIDPWAGGLLRYLCTVQVLGMLGSVKGKRVMELGAGIGRFTGDLGAQGKSVLALDFMQNLIEENERKHGHMGNISFRAGDACELEAEPESFEVVFTNWLLMYLGKALYRPGFGTSKLAGPAIIPGCAICR